MCGIFAYRGADCAADRIFEGLRRLEYRGYDSWGIATAAGGSLTVVKNTGAPRPGESPNPGAAAKSAVGVGHTRWATHGAVNQTNAHPHTASDGSFALVHNGIVENYQELKRELELAGFNFQTETDTEVVVRLIEQELGRTPATDAARLCQALRAAFLRLEGRNTIVVLASDGGNLLGIRRGSPLVVGLGEREQFIASDALSFADRTNRVIYVDEYELVVSDSLELRIYDARSGSERRPEVIWLDQEAVDVSKDGYPHFMLKEILEQPHTITSAANLDEAELAKFAGKVAQAGCVYCLGAGGAYYTAEQTAYFLRTIAGVQAVGLRAYEVDSVLPIVRPGDIALAISQSGETADTIEALNALQERGAVTAGVVNAAGSTISRVSEHAFSSRCGPEICVLSTKSSSAQMAFGLMLAATIRGGFRDALRAIHRTSEFLAHYLTADLLEQARRAALALKDCEHLFVLGTGAEYAPALIGALNIKEASCLHAEGFAAGELKHGVIALIEPGVPVIVFGGEGKDRKYMRAAAAEVKSRGAFLIGLGQEKDELYDEFLPLPAPQSELPAASTVSIIPCQLIAYHLAVLRGLDPDRPRNLAKSVTVK